MADNHNFRVKNGLEVGDDVAVTGNIAVSGTVDGVDIAARDAILTSTTTTAGAALPKAGGTMTGTLAMGANAITSTGTISSGAITSTGDITTSYAKTISMDYAAGSGDYHKGMSGLNQSSGTARGLHLFNYDADSNEGIKFWVGTNASRSQALHIASDTNATFAGNIVVTGTVDGVDIAARDAVLTSTTTTAAAALPKAGGTMTGDIFINGGSTAERNVRIQNTGNVLYAGVEGSSGNRFIGSSTGNAFFGTTSDSGLEFATHNNVRMVVDGDGKVGIGDTAPQDFLEVKGTSLGGITISNATHNHAALSFARSSTATARIFTTEPDALHTSAMHFQTSTAASGPTLVTAMTIDQGQHVLVGKTALNIGVTGQELRADGSSYFTSSSDTALGLNRLSTDGTVLEIRKDSTIVGSINSLSGRIAIGTGNTGLFFDSIRQVVTPHTMTGNTYSTTIDLGRTIIPFKDLHLSGGVQSAGGSTFTSVTPMSFNKAGSGTYNKTVLYDSQNDTANNVFSGLTLEMGRLTDSSSATPRTFTISDRGASNRWCFSQYGLSFNPTSGVATAAESLDDYEEGTWTPNFTTTGTDFSNASVGSATYTKVGRQVTLLYNCVMSGATSGGTGNVLITGLPFNVSADGIGTCMPGRITFTQTSWMNTATILSTTTMAVYIAVTAANGTSLPASQVNGNGTPYFSGTITYWTT